MLFEKNTILALTALIALTALAMAASSIQAPVGMTQGGVAFLVILAELAVYFLITMVMNARATIVMAALTSFVFAILRFLCSVVGGFLISMVPESVDFYNSIALCWVGNPVTIVLQVFLLLAAGPFILATYVPELVGKEQAELMGGNYSSNTSLRPQDGQFLEATPRGGFVQVFSFEELTGVIKKSPGLEGFVILSNEGLVVHKDLPIRLDLDSLIAKLYSHNSGIGHLMMDSGMTKVRRVMIEAKDHFVFFTTLNPNFSLVLVFHSRVTPEEVLTKVAFIAKTSREFVQWKYPSLPLAPGLTLDRIPLESI